MAILVKVKLLWDWGRLGMDGKPRPINISRGEEVIEEMRTDWVMQVYVRIK